MGSLNSPSGDASAAEAKLTFQRRLQDWLWRNRNSSRLAFSLNALSMALMALMGLWWARALVHTLRPEVYGLYLAFVAVAQLGGLGDLGISGAVGIRIMQHLARGEEGKGRLLLANARGVFLGLGFLFLSGFILLSPWLPGWLGFESLPGAGSLTFLFMMGGAGAATLIFTGYFQNLNYISGNVVWPIAPIFVLTQLGFCGQWWFAKRGFPLWAQYSVIWCANVAKLLVVIWMLKISHSWLGKLRPVHFDWKEIRQLITSSFWVYLCALGNLVYTTTDQILVNAGFGSAQLPAYRFNYKLCELSIAFLMLASFVSMPAIAQRLLNSDATQKNHGRSGLERLQKMQALGACGFAMLYLCTNDWFIGLWQGPGFNVPLALQVAFAMNLAVTIAGDAALQARGRLDLVGVRLAGIAVGGTGVLNLCLSYLAMKMEWLTGIALATVVAQSVLVLVMTRSISCQLQFPWRVWFFRGWFVPLIGVAAFAAVRYRFPPDGVGNALILALSAFSMLGIITALLGVDRQLIVDEWKRLRASFS